MGTAEPIAVENMRWLKGGRGSAPLGEMLSSVSSFASDLGGSENKYSVHVNGSMQHVAFCVCLIFLVQCCQSLPML